ncbi:hypothetical protein SAMN02745121_04656 [Nannocystis exedens]|uniref:Uncharacterized protein n=1 Tax=Nannocystis exedens TaxID=54 RepID=A0A1I2BFE7_9BACT|nr:hypothetical protein [Nannocystis exedens]PCC68001.1 hypothetical protein NAEX_01009 [Nannocystis exedens]SFE54922.1 hypothetical protein SAMN02745121_04656 [Nannocystis exedens]
MPWPLALLAVIVGLFVLDRLLLAAERGGYIYYRVRKPSGSGAGNALAELQQMLSPSTQHVIVAKREQRPEHNDDGGPPDPDDRPPGRDTLRR